MGAGHNRILIWGQLSQRRHSDWIQSIQLQLFTRSSISVHIRTTQWTEVIDLNIWNCSKVSTESNTKSYLPQQLTG